MADIYGTSEADKAKAAAGQFGTSFDAQMASLEERINKQVAAINAGIQVGMTAQELEDKRIELDNLKNETELLSRNIGAQYGYVSNQADKSAQDLATRLAQSQTQQAQVGAATLGRIAGVPAEFQQSAAVQDAARAQLGTEAAVQAYMGGNASVPSGLLPRVQGLAATEGAALGLSGISATGSSDFRTALTALEAKTQADLARDRTLMGAKIESQFRRDARQREERQREVASGQIAQLTQSFLSQIAQGSVTRAQLEAAAAGADTRTGKQVAQAKLKEFEDQERIRHNYALREIAARGQDAGLSPSQVAQQQALVNQSSGRNTFINNLITSPGASQYFRGLPTSQADVGNKPGFFTDGISVYYAPNGADSSEAFLVNPQELINNLVEQAGAIRNIPDPNLAREALKKWHASLSPADKQYLRNVLKSAADYDNVKIKDGNKIKSYNWADPDVIYRFIALPSMQRGNAPMPSLVEKQAPTTSKPTPGPTPSARPTPTPRR
jgi:hypothetical protein